MALDVTNLLKEYWTEQKLAETLYENNPLLGMITKKTDGGSDEASWALDLGTGGEGSPNFTYAQTMAAATGSQFSKFVLAWVLDYELMRVTNEVIRQCRNSPRDVALKITSESDRRKFALAKRIHRNLYQAGWGMKGQLANSSTSTTVGTLASRNQLRNFNVGDRIQFAQYEASGALRNSGGYLTVTAIDWTNATVTFNANISTVTGTSTTDFMFGYGQREDAASPTRKMLAGLAAYNPDTAPTAGDSFAGKDRSVDTLNMAGFQYPASGNASGTCSEVLINALQNCNFMGVQVTDAFCSSGIFGSLVKELEGRKRDITGKSTTGNIGYSGIEITCGSSGPIKIWADWACPEDRIRLVNMKSFYLKSLGELIQNDLQGETQHNLEASSGIEERYVFHGQLIVVTPRNFAVVKVNE